MILDSAQEQARLAALARYAVIGTLPETAFDQLTQLAAQLFGAPIALISLVDEQHQFFKACLGLDRRSTDCSLSFCAHLLDPGTEPLLVVPDAALDPRFRDNALVTGPPFVRFYAGTALITTDGYRLGSLCVLDDQPRIGLSPQERLALQQLAGAVMSELELRLRTLEMEREAAASRQLLASLRHSQRYSDTLLAVSDLMMLDLPPLEVTARALQLVAGAVDVDWANVSRVDHHEAVVLSSWFGSLASEAAIAPLAQRLPLGQGHLWQVLAGREPVYTDEYLTLPGGVPALAEAGTQSVAWVPLGRYEGVMYLVVFARFRGGQPWDTADRALLAAAGRSLQAAFGEHERRRLLRQAALCDALTGLGNRRALDEALLAVQDRSRVGLAVLDLDGLKAVNDRAGHADGDRLLRLFASALSAELPATAQAFRAGGDEFILLAAEGVSVHQKWTNEVLGWLDAAVAVVRTASFHGVSASAGVAFGNEGHSLQEALNCADRRMYQDKQARKTPVNAGPEKPPGTSPQSTTLGVPWLPADPNAPLHFLDLSVDPRTSTLRCGDTGVRLRPKELALMMILTRQPERVFSRATLIRQLWDRSEAEGLNLLRVNISALRNKLDRLTLRITIKIMSSGGYALHAYTTADHAKGGALEESRLVGRLNKT